ncbi:uncharacterized protein LOC142337595 isoform X2 [Convolutriloba macropyga]|uniref:uncharacterized protein LOC142337595 isoform X2 n=1 Tax=Convolutriloba macropyga TaxID=536237 RepID=UPI003F522EA8
MTTDSVDQMCCCCCCCRKTRTWRTSVTMLLGFFMFYILVFLFVTSSTSSGDGNLSRIEERPPKITVTDPELDSKSDDKYSLEGPCSKFKRKLDILIIILSDCYDEKGRDLIRATYGGLQRYGEFYTMTYFLVDVSNGVTDEANLLREMKVNDDVSLYVSEFSMSGSESLNFNISNFPKTDRWLKSCLHNSNYVMYFEHVQELRLPQLVEAIKSSPNYVIPSAVPSSNAFLLSSSSAAELIGAKVGDDWAVYIPNNIERFISQVPEQNRNLQDFILPRQEVSENVSEAVPEFFRHMLISGPADPAINDPVFKKLRIDLKYSKSRPKTVEPIHCQSSVPGADVTRILVFVDSQIKRSPQRDSIRSTFGSVKFVDRGGRKSEIFIRFLASQYKYLLFKDEDTRKLDTESRAHQDILSYFKMTIHDIPSFNITSSLRLSLEWAHENCSIADYIFFITDETFVNPYLLHDYIMHNMNPNEVYIDGLTRHTSLPVRKYNREGFVSKVLYPDMIFPPFTEFSNGALLSRKTMLSILSLPFKIRDPGLNEITLGIYAKCANIYLRPNPFHSPAKESYKPYPLNSISIPNCSANFSTFWNNVTTNFLLLNLEVKKPAFEPTTDLLQDFNKTDEKTGKVPSTTIKYSVERAPAVKICPRSRSKIELMFVIISAPGHFGLRAAIRSTWGKIKYYQGVHISKVFVLGFPGSGAPETLLPDMHAEADMYEDTVLFSLVDGYRNAATPKSINGLNWALTNCPHVHYVQKIDDDSMVNIHGLTYYLSHFAPKEKLYMGQVSKQGKVMRKFEKGMPEKFKKWIVNKDEYPADTYPPYALGGPGYVLSRDVASDFVREAWRTRTFVFEDAYVGILNTKVKINPVSHYLFNNNAVDNTRCDCHKYYAAHYLSAAQMCTNWFHLHSDLVKCQIRKCNF